MLRLIWLQIDSYIPKRVREAEPAKTAAQWTKEIFDAHKDVGNGKSDIEVRLLVLPAPSSQ